MTTRIAAAGAAGADAARERFLEIYEATSKSVLGTIICKVPRADLADDVFQDVYTALYVRLRKNPHCTIRHPLAYCQKLAARELAKHYKRCAKERDTEDRACDLENVKVESCIDDGTLCELVARKDLVREVAEMAKQLPLLTYKCFVLFYGQDMTAREIAEALSMTEGNVRVRLHRARRELLGKMKGDEL